MNPPSPPTKFSGLKSVRTNVRDAAPKSQRDATHEGPHDRSLGLDAKVMGEMEARITKDLPSLRSILVSRGGKSVYERTFADGSHDEAVNAFSCAKSYLSMLVGMLVKQGNFPRLDEKVAKVLPALAKQAHPSFGEVTIRHCLTMTIGYDLHFGDFDVVRAIRSQKAKAPGTSFLYNDVGPHIVSQIITKQTGQPAGDFARTALFEPLGIKNAQWATADDGFTIGGYALSMTPREMLRFAEFALAKGTNHGKQFVDESYFEESVHAQTKGGFPGDNGYGLLWWVSERGGHRTHYALGYGGQLILVCPDLDLAAVVVCTDELGPDILGVQDLYFDFMMRACI